ncbi:ATP-binding protein [Winogradskyella litoriviva]|uniref:ATP-binding protein n=1 Tax=Winogradskyella litoriviva TaxID=1220182 RepID=A0ABX2E8N0_9FLAO|nr:ATP-binding protein [Winogradskyella litoriviva]NRD24086.1 ATP-binding protein [Winogradskyella litoriviva]
MKSLKTSFLFFVLIFINKQNLFAQQRLDSLAYYSNKALHPQNYNDLIDSYDFFNKAYSESIENQKPKKSVHNLYYIASVEYKLGDYNKSEKSIVKAISLLDKLPNSAFKTQTRNSLYILMGLIYIEQRNESKAVEFYSKALEKAENPLDSAKIYNNMSLIYAEINDFQKVKQELENAYNLLPRIEDALTKSNILNNLGAAENELDSTKGLDLLLKALDIRESVGDNSTMYSSYAHLSDYYYKINNKVESKKYALKAFELAEIINSPSYKENALSLLIRLSDDNYAKKYKILNDSLSNAKQQTKNKFALMKYDASEANRKALVAQLENARLKNTRLVFILLLIFLVFAALLIYFILRAKHKKEKLQQVYITEKRISKKVHDEVANDVYHVMTKLQSNANDNESVLDDLEGIYKRTRDISKENSAIEVDKNFNELINDLLLSYKSNEVSIITRNNSKINWDGIPDIKKTTIYRVLQELMTNMRKHSKATIVVLNFNQLNKKVTIDYSDNGVGCNSIKSGGLLNAENRIKSINGTLTFESQINKGFKAQIKI